jgi:hypothetical protein
MTFTQAKLIKATRTSDVSVDVTYLLGKQEFTVEWNNIHPSTGEIGSYDLQIDCKSDNQDFNERVKECIRIGECGSNPDLDLYYELRDTFDALDCEDCEYPISILGHEYNEYVIGYVITTSKGDVNAQFQKCHSNHPQPAYLLYLGCEGDDTSNHLNDNDRDAVMDYIRNNPDMDVLEEAYTKAMYNGSPLHEKCAPIEKWEIQDWAEYQD